MTKDEIADIFERIRTWPPELQADAAAMLLRLEEQRAEDPELSPEEWEDLDQALAEAEREAPVPDEEMQALLSRYRRS